MLSKFFEIRHECSPFDPFQDPLGDTTRMSGRDLLRHYGYAGKDDTWGNYLGGLATEVVSDPTNFIPGKALLTTLRARKVVGQVRYIHKFLHSGRSGA